MTTDPVAPTGQNLAEWADRVVATLIDAAIYLAIYVVLWIVGAVVGAVSDILGLLVGFVTWLIGTAYFLLLGYLEGERGQSPGKAIRGLKVVRDGADETIGGGMGIVRRIAHIIDSAICFIGYLFPLWDPKKQTIADKLMTTVVVKGEQPKAFSADLFKP